MSKKQQRPLEERVATLEAKVAYLIKKLDEVERTANRADDNSWINQKLGGPTL